MKTALSATVALFVLANMATAEKTKAIETRTTALDLSSVYALNEARFDEEFTGRMITVTGNVRSIRKSTHRRYAVHLETAVDVNIVVFVDDHHRKELAAYAPGEEISLRGTCIGAVVPESDARRAPEIQLLKAQPLEKKRANSELELPVKAMP